MILVPWKMFEDQFHYFFAISAQLPNLIKKKQNAQKCRKMSFIVEQCIFYILWRHNQFWKHHKHLVKPGSSLHEVIHTVGVERCREFWMYTLATVNIETRLQSIICVFLFFSLVLFRNNWHISPCKFKAHSMVVWLTHTADLWRVGALPPTQLKIQV